MKEQAQHLFWPEQIRALSTHLLSNWAPGRGDASVAVVVDNVRSVVAMRLRLALGTVAMPVDIAAATVRALAIAFVPLAGNVQAGELLLKNVFCVALTAVAWTQWRALLQCMEPAHSWRLPNRTPRALFSYVALLGVALFAAGSDVLLYEVKEGAAKPATGALATIPFVSFLSFDGAGGIAGADAGAMDEDTKRFTRWALLKAKYAAEKKRKRRERRARRPEWSRSTSRPPCRWTMPCSTSPT